MSGSTSLYLYLFKRTLVSDHRSLALIHCLITGLRASNTGYLSPGQAIAERVLDPGPGHFVEIEMDTESIPQQFGVWSLNHDIAILYHDCSGSDYEDLPRFPKNPPTATGAGG